MLIKTICVHFTEVRSEMQLDTDKACKSLTALGCSVRAGEPGAEGDSRASTGWADKPTRTATLQDMSKTKSRDSNQGQPGVQRLPSKSTLRTSWKVISARQVSDHQEQAKLQNNQQLDH